MPAGRIHHLDLTVGDIARSTAFSDAVLLLVGFVREPDCPEGPLWRGAALELGLQAASAGGIAVGHDRWTPGLHHLAFGVDSAAAVDRVYESLLALGVTILDPPAIYPEYGRDYYATFFADPDGLKLEVAHT